MREPSDRAFSLNLCASVVFLRFLDKVEARPDYFLHSPSHLPLYLLFMTWSPTFIFIEPL